jgi:anti-sigma factor ChrR (cupin superfamily)
MAARGHREIFAKDVDWLTSSSGIKYAKIFMGAENSKSPMVSIVDFPPGVELSPHTHSSDYLEYVISGDITVGKIRYVEGDIRVVKGGTGYGPLQVGDQGCKAMIVFSDGSAHAVENLPRPRTQAR